MYEIGSLIVKDQDPTPARMRRYFTL